MKSILLTIILSSTSLYGQRINSTCAISNSIYELYIKDASLMAINKLDRQNRPEKDSVIIPRADIDTVLRALSAVYNAPKLPVYNLIKTIHNHFLNPVLGLEIKVDTNIIWGRNLYNNILPCGNQLIDSFLQMYKLKGIRKSSILKWYSISLNSDSIINYNALVKKMQVDTTFFVNTIKVAGDGHFIKDSIMPNYVDLTYSYGWEDCPSGCMSRYNLTVRVYNDCSVEFISTSGNPPPELGSIQSLNKLSLIQVFPNPFTDKLSIFSDQKIKSITISNLIGEVIYHLEFNERNSKNELELYEKVKNLGVYFLTVETGNENTSYKIIKTNK